MLLGWHLSLKKIKPRILYWVTRIAKIEGKLEEVFKQIKLEGFVAIGPGL